MGIVSISCGLHCHISDMENQVSWHGAGPNDEQAAIALAELDAKIAEVD